MRKTITDMHVLSEGLVQEQNICKRSVQLFNWIMCMCKFLSLFREYMYPMQQQSILEIPESTQLLHKTREAQVIIVCRIS